MHCFSLRLLFLNPADEAPKILEEEEELDRDTRFQVVQLKILLTAAKQTLEAIRDEPLAPAQLYPVSKRHAPMLEAVFPAGTTQ